MERFVGDLFVVFASVYFSEDNSTSGIECRAKENSKSVNSSNHCNQKPF